MHIYAGWLSSASRWFEWGPVSHKCVQVRASSFIYLHVYFFSTATVTHQEEESGRKNL